MQKLIKVRNISLKFNNFLEFVNEIPTTLKINDLNDDDKNLFSEEFLYFKCNNFKEFDLDSLIFEFSDFFNQNLIENV